MQDDSLLDLDSYTNALKRGTETYRPTNSRPHFQQSYLSKPKSTSRKNQLSPFKKSNPLKHRFQQMESEYDTITQRNTMNRHPSNIKSDINLHIQMNKKNSKREIKQLYNRQESRQQINMISSSSIHPDHYYKRIGTSRQQSKIFLQEMTRLLEGECESLVERINQFEQKVRDHIEKQYQKLKQSFISFIQQIFTVSKSSFLLSFQAKAKKINSGFYAIKEQFNDFTIKIKQFAEGLERSNWSKIIGQINEYKIRQDVQKLVCESQNMNAKSAVIELDRRQLQIVEKAFQTLLSPKT